jgi:hypothetical protein
MVHCSLACDGVVESLRSPYPDRNPGKQFGSLKVFAWVVADIKVYIRRPFLLDPLKGLGMRLTILAT